MKINENLSACRIDNVELTSSFSSSFYVITIKNSIFRELKKTLSILNNIENNTIILQNLWFKKRV